MVAAIDVRTVNRITRVSRRLNTLPFQLNLNSFMIFSLPLCLLVNHRYFTGLLTGGYYMKCANKSSKSAIDASLIVCGVIVIVYDI